MAKIESGIPVLAAIDVPATRAFWVDTLGFTLDFEVEGFVGVSRDELRLYISGTPDQLVPDNTQAWVLVHGLDDLHAEWSAKVATETSDYPKPAITKPADTPWSTYEFAVRDPAGNCVHFVES